MHSYMGTTIQTEATKRYFDLKKQFFEIREPQNRYVPKILNWICFMITKLTLYYIVFVRKQKGF